MIKAEQIPDQVIAAFDHAFLEERQSGWTLDMAYRHAFAAGLAAWPGIEIHTDGTEDWIELTLTQENNNADG
jgi:hypothetical protein